jgi:hypothetical protein
MPITNFSLGPDATFGGEAEVGPAAHPAASVENDPQRSSLGLSIFTATIGWTFTRSPRRGHLHDRRHKRDL